MFRGNLYCIPLLPPSVSNPMHQINMSRISRPIFIEIMSNQANKETQQVKKSEDRRRCRKALSNLPSIEECSWALQDTSWNLWLGQGSSGCNQSRSDRLSQWFLRSWRSLILFWRWSVLLFLFLLLAETSAIQDTQWWQWLWHTWQIPEPRICSAISSPHKRLQ